MLANEASCSAGGGVSALPGGGLSHAEAYTWFFRAEFPAVMRAVQLMVSDRSVAEEVTQDAFAQLYRHWPRVSGYERPDAWVRRVATRLAVRAVRHERLQRAVRLQGSAEYHDDLVDVDLQRALRDLPPMQRAAVVLYYLEDRPAGDVAEILGCAVATARVHLFKVANGWAVSSARTSPMSVDQRLAARLRAQADRVSVDVDRQLHLVRRRIGRRRRLLWTASALSAAALVVLAAQLQHAFPPDRRTPAAPGQPALVGSWRTTVSESGLARQVPIAGTWTMTFRSDGTLTVDASPRFAAAFGAPPTGVWSTAGPTLRTNGLTARSGHVCDDLTFGSYQWSVTAGALLLRAVDDHCAPRVAVLAGSQWQRIGTAVGLGYRPPAPHAVSTTFTSERKRS